jgi:hypothetical protein
MTSAIAGLRSMVEGRPSAVDAMDEPLPMHPTKRFLTDPVKSDAPR